MWFKKDNLRLIARIYVKPRAKKSVIVGIINNELHVAIHAKPAEGEANKELIAFLAAFFKLPKSQIIVVAGNNSRHKTIHLPINQTLAQFIANSVNAQQ